MTITLETATPVAAPPATTPAPTYVDSLLDVLVRAGRAPVLTFQDRDVTGLDLARSIARYARALELIGIGRGDFVVLLAPNTPDALAVRYAVHIVGAAAMYLPDTTSAPRRAELIRDLDPTLLVAFAETAGQIPVTTIPVVTVRCDVDRAYLRLDDLAEIQDCDRVRGRARAGDQAVIVSSGGTTGLPKASTRDFATYGAMVSGPWRPDRRLLANGELAHLTQALVDQTLLGGGTVVLTDTCDPGATLTSIERHGVTDVFLVEPQLIDVVDHPDVARRDLSSLRTVLHIGASAPTTLRRRAYDRLGPVLVHTYGASEVGIVSALPQQEYDPAHPNRFQSAGRIRGDVDVRFRSHGVVLPGCRMGTIEVRSPTVASGYRNRSTDAAATFGADGWCRTGDLGYLDVEGYLHILGRAADVITVDDGVVTPTAAEDTLMRTASVRVATVVADRPTGRWAAAVVPWPGTRVDLVGCRAALADDLGSVVAALIVLVVVDAIPLTGQGKPDRARITALIDSATAGARDLT